MFRVLGMGVAVSVSRSTSVRKRLSRSFWAHAEAVFLVHDHQPEPLEPNIARQEPVSADHDVDVAIRETGGHLANAPWRF